MPNPILARADALMSRRRQIQDNDDLPVLTDVADDGDDIPVLTDSVPPETPVGAAAATPLAVPEAAAGEPGLERELDQALAAFDVVSADEPETPPYEQLARELAGRIEQRLAAELPRLVESALRDFLAEQEMIAQQQRRS